MKKRFVMAIIRWILEKYMDELRGELKTQGKHIHLSPKKGKIWTNPFENPNGHHCHFTLAAGCEFKFNMKPPHDGGVGWHLA